MNNRIKKVIIIMFTVSLIGSVTLSYAGGSVKIKPQTTKAIQKINKKIQIKIDKLLFKFFTKIEKNNKIKDKQINIYNNIIDKIYNIKDNSNGSKKLLLKYLIEKIKERVNIINGNYYNLNGKKFIGGEVIPYFDIKINGNQLSFQKEVNGEINNYTITATKFNNEITFDTIDGPYFVFKEERCNIAMGGFPYYYSAYVYEGGEETFAGCSSPLRDFSVNEFSGFGKDNAWTFKYKNGNLKLLKNGQTTNMDVVFAQNGEGFTMTSSDEKFSIDFRPNICSFEDNDSQLYQWNINGYINGEYYTGCAK